MILDERAEFCDATALNTGGAGSYLIGDVMDLSVARAVGNGQSLYMVIEVTTAVTSGGSATVAFSICSDAAAAIAVDGSQSTHVKTDAIGKASLTAGHTIVLPLPPEGSKAYERYLGVVQTTATAALTAGAVNAYLSIDPKGWKAMPDATN